MQRQESQDKRHKAVHLVVVGRVQGVGFRYFAQTSARRTGVTGWVRNLEDGSVEIRAEGTEDRLNQFIQAVHRGPSNSMVTNVNVAWEAATGASRSFHIRY